MGEKDVYYLPLREKKKQPNLLLCFRLVFLPPFFFWVSFLSKLTDCATMKKEKKKIIYCDLLGAKKGTQFLKLNMLYTLIDYNCLPQLFITVLDRRIEKNKA